jgi:hypothetical protein
MHASHPSLSNRFSCLALEYDELACAPMLADLAAVFAYHNHVTGLPRKVLFQIFCYYIEISAFAHCSNYAKDPLWQIIAERQSA